MTIFLILLYILEANGYIIPVGCYIAVWTLTAIKAICGFITTMPESMPEGGKLRETPRKTETERHSINRLR